MSYLTYLMHGGCLMSDLIILDVNFNLINGGLYIYQHNPIDNYWYKVSYNSERGFNTREEAFDAVVKHELKISTIENGVVI